MGNLGADGGGSFVSYSGKVSNQNYGMQYEVYQVHGAGDPSVVEVFFTLFCGDVSIN